MRLFYNKNISEQDVVILEQIESTHIIKVLRKKLGDVLDMTDGKGKHYKCEIVDANSKKCLVKVIFVEKVDFQRNYKLHIAIAPTKNIDRFEWFVEKSVEIGIDRITPIICEFSERKKIKIDRLEKKAISAMKQSLKFYNTQIDDFISFKDFIKKETKFKKYIAYCKAKQEFTNFSLDENNLFLIGPEGGFSKEEVELAINSGYKTIKISNSRLRTETAGVFVSSLLNILNFK